MELQRIIICSKCGEKYELEMKTGLDVKEMNAHTICPKCGNEIQVSFAVVEKKEERKEEPAKIDDSMMPTEFPSDAIRQLIDEK